MFRTAPANGELQTQTHVALLLVERKAVWVLLVEHRIVDQGLERVLVPTVENETVMSAQNIQRKRNAAARKQIQNQQINETPYQLFLCGRTSLLQAVGQRRQAVLEPLQASRYVGHLFKPTQNARQLFFTMAACCRVNVQCLDAAAAVRAAAVALSQPLAAAAPAAAAAVALAAVPAAPAVAAAVDGHPLVP